MADAIPQMVWIADANGHAEFFNQQWNRYTGIATGPMPAQEVANSFIHPDDGAHTIAAWTKAQQAGQIFSVEHRIRSASGEYRWFLVRAEPYRDPQTGEIVRWFGTSTDVHDRKMAEQTARHTALHDTLTGLPNRTMLFEYASHLLAHHTRTSQCAAVLFIDLDRFKPINDTHGHEAGDAVLKEVADRISRSLRTADIVTRLGGDEFVVLLQDIRNPGDAADVGRHIGDRICQPYEIGELKLSLSMSLGISIFPDDGRDIETLVAHADLAMYQAKQGGRNNVEFYSPELAAGTKRQLAIEQQLKSALDANDFHLCYQPVLNVETGEVVSVEALLRWQHPEIGPEQFVPIAEATGMINPISRWLLAAASRQYKTWISHGLPAIPIAVNVSVVEFRDKDFINRFNRTISEHGIEPSALQLELTETAVMDDIDYAVTVLAQLKQLGVKVLLDDFGTGHSSLAYLARLPLNKIKIDKSFISGVENDVASKAITGAMIALGRTLDLDVVAEGIESANVLNYICLHGCTQGQGFYLGRPMSGEIFEPWYRAHAKSLKGGRPNLGECH
jgi:diguanylate cyclase (GGDEF)-like protein/PAS domain S-box-containing protein